MKKALGNIFRALMIIISSVMLGCFVETMFSNMVNIGNIVGSALCLWIICVCIKPVHHSIRDTLKKNAFTGFVYRFVSVFFILLTVYGAVVTGAMVYAAMQPPVEGATALALGAYVRPDGEPSNILNGRIMAAEEYLKGSPNTYAILTGGQGDNEVMSEADCMYRVLTEDGISAERLYKETEANNTFKNIVNSKRIIEDNGLSDDLAICTDGFHQLRARLIANQTGISGKIGAVNAQTRLWYIPTYAVREWFALPYQLIIPQH